MQGCPHFSHLTLTGGAIGCGPPLATGAAVAVPARRVINLQADGSAMYTLQVRGGEHDEEPFDVPAQKDGAWGACGMMEHVACQRGRIP